MNKEIKYELIEKYKNEKLINELFSYIGEDCDLPKKHLCNIIDKNITSNYSNVLVQYYIDSYRILEMKNSDTDDLLNVDNSTLLQYHQNLSNNFKIDKNKFYNENLKKNKEKYNHLLNFYTNEYEIEIISSVEELEWEGKYMNHCIASYINIILNEKYIAFRFLNRTNFERLTLGCKIIGNNIFFEQLKAHSNYSASEYSKDLIKKHCEEKGIIINNFAYDLI